MDVHAARRSEVLSNLDGALLLLSTPVTLRNGDVENAFRQDSDFWYLSGFDEPESALLLTSQHEAHQYVLFVRPRDPEREVWDGGRAGVDGACSRFGADVAFPIGELAERLPEYLTGVSRLHYRLGRAHDQDALVLGAVSKARGRGRSPKAWPASLIDPCVLLHERRLRKQDDELEAMQRAAEVTGRAHVAAMAAAQPGQHEYEVEAVLRQVFRQGGAERVAYEPIVGSGPNATVLHYRENRRQMEDGDLLLIDAGCELGFYASDVTRTFPVNGRFTEPQRRLYEVVLASQTAAVEAVKPGATIEDVHDAAVQELVGGLLKLGLLSGDVSEIIAEQHYRRFYMHRTSHWLGMDVHDVGEYFVGEQPRPLEPSMVLTVEPGLYVAASDDDAPPEYRGLGIRIEDDVVVTETGRRELTGSIPRSVDDIERACRG